MIGHLKIYIYFKNIYIYIYIYIYMCVCIYIYVCICIYIYKIYIYIQTFLFYQNSSVWLDMQDARSRDRNRPTLRLTKSQLSRSTRGPGWLREFLRYLFSNSSSSCLLIFLYPIGYQSAQFF